MRSCPSLTKIMCAPPERPSLAAPITSSQPPAACQSVTPVERSRVSTSPTPNFESAASPVLRRTTAERTPSRLAQCQPSPVRLWYLAGFRGSWRPLADAASAGLCLPPAYRPGIGTRQTPGVLRPPPSLGDSARSAEHCMCAVLWLEWLCHQLQGGR